MAPAQGIVWDEDVDVLIAGSGAGGLAAALTCVDSGLSAVIAEKADVYGGSTALSGGGVWIPNNPTLVRKGLADPPEDVRRYLQEVVGERVPGARLDVFVTEGPKAMEMLERLGPHLRFSWCPGYSDYHPEVPGGRARGRTIEPLPFDKRKLGADEPTLRGADLPVPMGLWLTGSEVKDLAMVRRTWAGRRMLLVAGWRVVSNFVRRRHMATLGQALVARMRLSLTENRGAPVWLSAPVVDLITDDGGVLGAVVDRQGRRVNVRTRRGVVLASGGFEFNEKLRQEFLPAPGVPIFSAGAPSNTGDGQLLGKSHGAALDIMDDAWWMPSIKRPDGGVFPLVSERCIPPMVIVNVQGERFTNESAPYVNFVHDQLEGGYVPIYEIFDAKARRRYQFAGILPGQSFPAEWYASGLVTRADSIEDLAGAVGIPPEALARTVARFNEFARKGHDDEFGRGDSAYDRYYGDPTLPNPNLDVIAGGPYYAVRVEAGDLGTKGGLVTDEHGNVLRPDGAPIPGLYATGNVSASVMGNEYAGAGATIGPAITYGYVAVKHAAQRAERTSDSRLRATG